MELFQENLEWKVCEGKNNNERKQRYKALLNNRAHQSCYFIEGIQYLFIEAMLLQKAFMHTHQQVSI